MTRYLLAHNGEIYTGTAEEIAGRILAKFAGPIHPAVLADTVREVEYHAAPDTSTPAEVAQARASAIHRASAAS